MKFKNPPLWLNIVYGCIIAIVGVLSIVFAVINPSVVDKVISYSLAISLFLLGILLITSSLIVSTHEFFTFQLVIGSVAIALGVVLCINTSLITNLLILFIGAFLVALGAISLVQMVLSIVYKYKPTDIIYCCTIFVLSLTLGILALVYSQSETKTVIYVIVGITIAVTGITDVIYWATKPKIK